MTSQQEKAIVVKIGGATMGSHHPIIEDIVELQRGGRALVVVHGGGNLVTEWLSRQGIPTRFVRGERVTDQAALEMVTAVLGGLVNKQIVASINCLGGRAIGITGVDGALVESRARNEELGYVGAVVRVNTRLLQDLLQAGYIPVVAPLSLYSQDRPDNAPGILNINGDPLAGEIAAALGAERLIFLTDVAGVSDRDGKLLRRLTPNEAKGLIASGVAAGGMIPKINACLRALSSTAVTCIIDGRQPHALLRAARGEDVGTIIRAN